VKIKWLGHSCFLISSDTGVRIVTDPFNEKVGYELPVVEADIVTTSHGHYDHNNVSIVKGDYKHINMPGSVIEKGMEITGVLTFHDEAEGSKRGENVVFKFKVDGLNVCHCGDLGHILNEEQLDGLGKVDVLLIPVGGTYTIDALAACEVVKQLKPAVTIPMHFKTEVLGFPIDGVNNFLAKIGGGERVGSQEIKIDSENIGKLSKVIVLDYK